MPHYEIFQLKILKNKRPKTEKSLTMCFSHTYELTDKLPNNRSAHDRSILEGYERAIDNFGRKYEEKVISTNQIVAF